MTTAECRNLAVGVVPSETRGKQLMCQKNLKLIYMVKQIVVIGVFGHVESKSGIHFLLTLIVQGILAIFLQIQSD